MFSCSTSILLGGLWKSHWETSFVALKPESRKTIYWMGFSVIKTLFYILSIFN